MKILIFAGGSGKRLWPLSRKTLPKQFKKMFNGKSTLQLAVERVERTFGTHNIYICTNENHVGLAKEQVPQIPITNIVGEPTKRDLAASIGYNFIRLRKQGYTGPISILWADHLMENPHNFVDALKKGENLILENKNRYIFIGEKPRYPENNLGWIHLGKKIKKDLYEFVEWHYRPPVEKCKKIFESGEWRWNPGYFICDLEFTLDLYKKYMPKMYKDLEKIAKDIGTYKEADTLKKIYPKLESIHFDNAILEKIPASQAVVLDVDMGWSDPGTLYALKEALVEKAEDNYQKGLIVTRETNDCLVINEDKDKLLTTVGINGMVVVNTKDAMIVAPKEKVREIAELVKELEKSRELKKYI